MDNAHRPRVAVTGLTGFIGRRLAPALVTHCDTVRALVRSAPNDLPGEVESCTVSLLDKSQLAQELHGVDRVVHLAGTVRGARAEDFEPANVDSVRTLCEALSALEQPPPALLISSLAASRPELSHYAASKRRGEDVLAAYPHLSWTTFRPTAVYGPGDKEMRPLLAAARRGLTVVPGNPAQRVSMLHVDDLVSAVMAWVINPRPTEGGTFTIDDGTPGGYDWDAISRAVGSQRNVRLVVPVGLLRALARANVGLAKTLGYAPMLTPEKVNELTFPSWPTDDATFGALTGWHPKHDLASGVQHTFNED